MREIKFRVWSPIHMEFWPVTLGHEFTFKDIDIVEQFTGLKDKNGKEIYEGDIVKVVRFDTTCTVKFGEYDNDREYDDNVSGNGWYIENDIPTDYFLRTLYSEEEYVVVGNIHQNAELI